MSLNDTATHTVDWSTVAEGWDRNRESVETMKTDLTRRLLAFLAVSSGDQVLELGAGTGELARTLSEAVGDSGSVLASDVAAGMVKLIEATTADLPNVHAALIDASDLGPRDDTFDAVAFRMGLMFVPRPEVAMAEIRRVLKPGGRVAVTTWAAAEHNMWLVSVGMAAMINGIIAGPMPTDPGGPLSITDASALEELARSAGFAEVTVDAVDLSYTAADVDDHIAHVTSLAPPIAVAYAAATIEQRAAFRGSVADLTKQFQTDAGLVIPARALLLQAR